MSRGVMQPSQQKLAEKLTILNDRGIGMLTRVYNIKKVRTHIHRCVLILARIISYVFITLLRS
uniref:Uncharacterized protein n=1 Tax=Xiphophorus couchianus TaxID=32473 RepID=A0A3B5M5S6_9TELE